jgi:hypothetical protein
VCTELSETGQIVGMVEDEVDAMQEPDMCFLVRGVGERHQTHSKHLEVEGYEGEERCGYTVVFGKRDH